MVLIEATPDGLQAEGHLRDSRRHEPELVASGRRGGRLYLREQDTLYVYNVSDVG